MQNLVNIKIGVCRPAGHAAEIGAVWVKSVNYAHFLQQLAHFQRIFTFKLGNSRMYLHTLGLTQYSVKLFTVQFRCIFGHADVLIRQQRHKGIITVIIIFNKALCVFVLQTNADYYNASVYQAPFNTKTLKQINEWVETNTDGMIDKILDEISRDAVMYLINALAFDAEWEIGRAHV